MITIKLPSGKMDKIVNVGNHSIVSHAGSFNASYISYLGLPTFDITGQSVSLRMNLMSYGQAYSIVHTLPCEIVFGNNMVSSFMVAGKQLLPDGITMNVVTHTEKWEKFINDNMSSARDFAKFCEKFTSMYYKMLNDN